MKVWVIIVQTVNQPLILATKDMTKEKKSWSESAGFSPSKKEIKSASKSKSKPEKKEKEKK